VEDGGHSFIFLCVCECLLLISFELFHVGRCWGEVERVDVDEKILMFPASVAWAWQVRVTGLSFGKSELRGCRLASQSYGAVVWQVRVTGLSFGKAELRGCRLASQSYGAVVW
jgi:hypothetical protein